MICTFQSIPFQWIYEDINKYDIDEESRKLLEEDNKEILQIEYYEDYGYLSYIDI